MKVYRIKKGRCCSVIIPVFHMGLISLYGIASLSDSWSVASRKSIHNIIGFSWGHHRFNSSFVIGCTVNENDFTLKAVINDRGKRLLPKTIMRMGYDIVFSWSICLIDSDRLRFTVDDKNVYSDISGSCMPGYYLFPRYNSTDYSGAPEDLYTSIKLFKL